MPRLKEVIKKIDISFSRKFVSRLGNFLIRLLFNFRIKDTQCGFKLFPGKVADNLFRLQKLNSFSFDVEILALASLFDLRVVEIPINLHQTDESRIRTWRDSFRVGLDLMTIKLNIWTRKYKFTQDNWTKNLWNTHLKMKLTPKKFLNFGEVLIFMLLIGAIFLINHFAPLYTDDYLYSFQYNQGFTFQDPAQLTYVPIHNVSDYFHSLKTLYLHLTGRVVPHGLLQIILMFPPYIFDIINTLALFLLCYLMAYWVAYKDKQKMLLYTLLAFSLFYIAVSRTETNFYLAVFSCNYIWTQIIVLIFLLPFRYHIEDNNYRSKSWVFAILMLILGLVAGDTNEPLIPGVLMFVFLYGGYCLVTRKPSSTLDVDFICRTIDRLCIFVLCSW